jgi:hypothetical protein
VKKLSQPTRRTVWISLNQSQLLACLNSRFGACTGSELRVIEKGDTLSCKRLFEEVTDIPHFGADAPKPKLLTFQIAPVLGSAMKNIYIPPD